MFPCKIYIDGAVVTGCVIVVWALGKIMRSFPCVADQNNLLSYRRNILAVYLQILRGKKMEPAEFTGSDKRIRFDSLSVSQLAKYMYVLLFKIQIFAYNYNM
jgi:hypothetical protein